MPWEVGAVLAGVLLLLISTPRILIHLYEWRKDQVLLRDGMRVNGIITEAVTYPNDDSLNTGQYRFVADFADTAGVTRFAKSRFADTSKEKYLHKEVVIVFDPKDPSKSRFLVDISIVRDVVEYVCVFVAGVVLVLIGA